MIEMDKGKVARERGEIGEFWSDVYYLSIVLVKGESLPFR